MGGWMDGSMDSLVYAGSLASILGFPCLYFL